MPKKSAVAISEVMSPPTRGIDGDTVRQILDILLDTMNEGALILGAGESPDEPVILDMSNSISSWTGQQKETMCGMPLADIVSFDDGAIAGLEKGHATIRVLEGDSIPVDVTMHKIPDNPGFLIAAIRRTDDPAGFLARVVAEKTAAENARDDFFARINHDLRTPLNGILGFSDIMQQGIFGEIEHDRYRGYAKDIHVAGQTLKKKIDELLEISTIAKEPSKIDCFSISSLLRDVINAPAKAPGKRVDILADVADSLPDIQGDIQSVERLIEILIENAFDSAPEESRVSVSAVLAEDCIILAIEDQGTPPDHPVSDVFTMPPSGRDWYLKTPTRSLDYFDLMQFLCQRTGIRLATKAGPDGGHIIALSVPTVQTEKI